MWSVDVASAMSMTVASCHVAPCCHGNVIADKPATSRKAGECHTRTQRVHYTFWDVFIEDTITRVLRNLTLRRKKRPSGAPSPGTRVSQLKFLPSFSEVWQCRARKMQFHTPSHFIPPLVTRLPPNDRYHESILSLFADCPHPLMSSRLL